MTSSLYSTPGPLNPGDVVSAALRIYRDRFKTYFGISAKAILWLIVPIYGWAKYSMYVGLMSRLVFQELMNAPETPRQAHQQLKPKLWSFLWLGFLLFIILTVAFFIVIIATTIVVGITGTAFTSLLAAIFGPGGSFFGVLITGLLFAAVFIIGLLQVVSRLMIAEVPLAIEPQIGATDSIRRSWQLTESSIVRIQFVVLAAYLITLPFTLIVGFLPQIFLFTLEPGTLAYSLLYIFSLILSLLANMLTLPFWQAVKGVLYYDVRSRREGLDLKIEDQFNTGDQF